MRDKWEMKNIRKKKEDVKQGGDRMKKVKVKNEQYERENRKWESRNDSTKKKRSERLKEKKGDVQKYNNKENKTFLGSWNKIGIM